MTIEACVAKTKEILADEHPGSGWTDVAVKVATKLRKSPMFKSLDDEDIARIGSDAARNAAHSAWDGEDMKLSELHERAKDDAIELMVSREAYEHAHNFDIGEMICRTGADDPLVLAAHAAARKYDPSVSEDPASLDSLGWNRSAARVIVTLIRKHRLEPRATPECILNCIDTVLYTIGEGKEAGCIDRIDQLLTENPLFRPKATLAKDSKRIDALFERTNEFCTKIKKPHFTRAEIADFAALVEVILLDAGESERNVEIMMPRVAATMLSDHADTLAKLKARWAILDKGFGKKVANAKPKKSRRSAA